jgi:hypothetical protein
MSVTIEEVNVGAIAKKYAYNTKCPNSKQKIVGGTNAFDGNHCNLAAAYTRQYSDASAVISEHIARVPNKKRRLQLFIAKRSMPLDAFLTKYGFEIHLIHVGVD